MAVTDQLGSLATRVAAEFNAVRAETAVDGFLAATFGATTSFDLAASDNHKLTVTGDTVLDASNLTEGQAGSILLSFSGGPHTVSWAAKWRVPPTVPTDADQVHWLVYQCHSGSQIGVGLVASYP